MCSMYSAHQIYNIYLLKDESVKCSSTRRRNDVDWQNVSLNVVRILFAYIIYYCIIRI